MLRNYLKIIFRNLIKHKTFSLINVIGLAVGMASFIMITLWIRHELNFEQFHSQKDQLYRVYTNIKEEGRVLTGNTTPVPLAEVLKNDFPEIDKVCRTSWITNHLFQVEDNKITAAGIFTEPEFLNMFSFPLLKGDPATVLSDVHSIVVTEDFAFELFGNEDPINKMIRLDNKDNFKVTGVLKNIPDNTSFYFKYLLPYANFRKSMPWAENNWTANAIHTYVALTPETSVSSVQAKIQDLPGRHGEENVALLLHPLTKWHLYSRFEDGKVTGGRIEVVHFFGIIAVLILVIACINFMNLSTVRSEKRAKEVGVRKCIGASKKHLVYQFLGESVLLAFIAGLLALTIVVVSLPLFNELMSISFSIDYGEAYLWGVFVFFILLTGAAAGIYPAFYLSSVRPVSALKGTFRRSQASLSFNKALVILQFTFGIVLIVTSIVIQKQIQHAQQRDSGYDKNRLIYTQYFGDLKKNYPLLKRELLSSGLASSVTQTSSPITELWDTSAKLDWKGKEPGHMVNFNLLCADEDLVETIGLELVAGRDFNLKKFSTDSVSCLLNESAAKVMGFQDPLGQVIKSDGTNWKVVGVVKDFVLASPYATTEPLVILGAKSWFHVVHIKLNQDMPLAESLEKTEKIVKSYNPSYPFEFSFVDDAYALKFSDEKRVAKLAGLFTGLSIFISCLGLFGLAAYAAEQRTREIGIRKVLGATEQSIVLLLSKDFIKLVLIAILIASPIAWYFMSQWLQDFAYRIDISWWIFALAGLSAIAIALITVSFHAIKAALRNPVRNLRTE
ncbi:antimicrobial peptide ABC transporter permease [Flammeovirgaceae bacterium 311]|nr:antimicrobial peptide ABC transporter permease [Flammeovirgaceae bacterium 311]